MMYQYTFSAYDQTSDHKWIPNVTVMLLNLLPIESQWVKDTPTKSRRSKPPLHDLYYPKQCRAALLSNCTGTKEVDGTSRSYNNGVKWAACFLDCLFALCAYNDTHAMWCHLIKSCSISSFTLGGCPIKAGRVYRYRIVYSLIGSNFPFRSQT